MPLLAAEPTSTSRPCPAGSKLGSFELLVQPPGEMPRPVREVSRIVAGYKLLYRPVGFKNEKGKIALLYSRRDTEDLELLAARPADEKSEWTVPARINVLGLVYGPQGLDIGKVDSLLQKDKGMVAQLADYAEQTAQTEALIEALTSGQTTPSRNVDAAISGFAARYGSTTKIDPTAPVNQQALLLVQSLNPALSAYDPLAAESNARMQQSAGVAAAVAGLFFGNTVGLAAGGASLFLNLRTMMFPDTEFRSSFVQLAAPGKEDAPLALCAKQDGARARTRVAYLWAMRLPDAEAPALTLPAVSNLPAGLKSTVPVTAEDWKLLARARDWQLERDGGATAVPIAVRLLPEKKELEFDFARSDVAPGTFRLSATWDWGHMAVPGEINLRPLPTGIALSPDSGDKLITGSGPVNVDVTGTDLEFSEKLTLRSKSGDKPLDFKLPKGPRGGPQTTLSTSIDTTSLAPGHYTLLAAQPDGKSLETAIRILPPNPVLRSLPLRVNLGETSQTIHLVGAGLDRIEAVESPAMTVTLAAGKPDERDAVVRLGEKAVKGERAGLQLKVEGLREPLTIPAAVVVAGPRPRIIASQVTLPADAAVAVQPGELPAGVFASVALQVDHIETVPGLHLRCGPKTIAIAGTEARQDIRLSQIRPGSLFLSLDPTSAGPVGCKLTAIVESGETGLSDPYSLGRIVLLPRIDSFQWTDEKLPGDAYAGTLTGFNLELVEKTGWNGHDGYPVQGLPTPIAGEGQKQSLKVGLPWPPPAPRAPLYIWLRGDSEGRLSKLRY